MNYSSVKAGYKETAELIQSNAKAAGIDIKLGGEETSVVNGRRVKKDYDLILDQTWGTPYEPHNTATLFLDGETYCGASSGFEGKEELYKNIENALTTTSKEERKKAYEKTFTTIHDHALMIPISHTTLVAIGPKNMHFINDQYQYPFETLYFEK